MHAAVDTACRTFSRLSEWALCPEAALPILRSIKRARAFTEGAEAMEGKAI